MSSPTTEIAETAMVAVDVPVADTVEKAPRRFPPPCWTQEETLALIEAYRERWYALRRGYLRTADWDAVAASVASRCPGASPAKTCAQCRHKMEKLRQRYRAEKQRAVSFPYPGGRYLSSWFFFENMEAMENGTTPPTAVKKPENPIDESRLKSFLDQNLLKLKLKSKNTADSSPDSGYDNSSIKSKRSNSLAMIPMDYSTDKLEEDEIMNLGRRQQPINAVPKSSFKSKSKISSKLFNNFDITTGFHHEILPPIKKSTDPTHKRNPNEEFWARIPINNTTISSNFKPKYWDPNSDSKGATQGLKRERDAVEEIVESIKLLGEGFMRMEKEKMEMAREMEAVRMEMEMKRNEMLLESQKQIVDAFLKGLFEIRKNKKPKSGNVTPNLAEQ